MKAQGGGGVWGSPAAWLRRGVIALLVLVVTAYVGACCAFLWRWELPSSSASGSVAGELAGAGTGGSGSGGAAAQFVGTLRSAVRGSVLVPSTPQDEHLVVRKVLGRGTWNMLHRMAAQYPRDPTPAQRDDMATYFRVLGEFYPCDVCATHFRTMLAANPVEAGNNKELSLWLCRIHNIVNTRLHKPEQFPCTLDALGEKYGECGCFEDFAAANATSPDPSVASAAPAPAAA